MKYIIINLSPRQKGTSSMLAEYFAERLKENGQVKLERLYSYLDNMQELLSKIKDSESIIFIGPCYVTTFPAETFALLEKMEETADILHGQSMYGMIQGGMPYIHTHECGIKSLKNYADLNNVIFKGGFVMGGGAPLNGRPLEKVIGANKIVPAVNCFIENIKEDNFSPAELYTEAAYKVPKLMARLLLLMMNSQIRKDMRKKGVKMPI